MSAREEVLARIDAALALAPMKVPRAQRPAPAARSRVDLLHRFCLRVAGYQADVHRLRTEGECGETLTGICATRGSRSVARAPGATWPIWDVNQFEDSVSLPATSLDDVDAALTGCALAIAETGTIVLDGTPRCGRRALTLVPDHHICVVLADQIVADVPEAIGVRRGGP